MTVVFNGRKQPAVASAAEQAAHLTGSVVVIHVKGPRGVDMLSSLSSSFWNLITDSTAPALCVNHSLIALSGKPVLSQLGLPLSPGLQAVMFG